MSKAKRLPGWYAGRGDTVSYTGDGEGPFRNVYVDDPNGEMHLGERLPATVARCFDIPGMECREVARLVAAAQRLLTASRKAIAAYDAAHETGKSYWRGEDVDEMRAAVAEAEGRVS